MDMKSAKNIKPLYKRWRFYIYLFLAVITGLLLIFLSSLISLRWINPPATSFTLRENWSEVENERYNLRDWWVAEEEISEHTKWAVIASEDQLFWEHRGFDMDSIQEAWEERQSGERSRGASTISQQVAKNLYLWPAQSFFRKGLEAGITVLIELLWPKERILEVYLNIAEFGPGIFGIGKASDSFFGIHATSLEPEMSARMAAVLPSPKRMRVEPPSPFTQERSLWVLRQMTQLSGIAFIPQEDDDPEEDFDPMLFEAETGIDEVLSDTADALSEDDELREFDLPDSLLNNTEPDSLPMINGSGN